MFTYDYIETNSADWQTHLQRISVRWKKTESGKEFFDVDSEPEKIELKPRVHHFRSSNMKSVANELEKHWLHIVDHNICNPIHQISGNEHEKVVYTKTKFLSDQIEIENPSSDDMLCLHADNQVGAKEELLECDVTWHILFYMK